MKSRLVMHLLFVSINACYYIVASFSTTNQSFVVRTKVDRRRNHIETSSSRLTIIRNSPIQNSHCSRLLPLSAIQNESQREIKNDNPTSNRTDKAISKSEASPTDRIIDEKLDQAKIISTDKNEHRIDVLGLEDRSQQEQRDETRNFGSDDGLGAYDPAKKLPLKREVIVGDPQIKVKKEEKSVAEILTELAAIQKQGPQKYCILGSRHVSYLHQQIIELLSYALVLSENHVYTSGAMGTNASAIRGALRAGRPDLLTVILPQSLHKQTDESQELLRGVTDLITMPQNDEMSLDVASRLCNSKLLSETDQLVAFAFHESTTVIEATKEAKKLEMLVTTLYLD